MVMPLFARETIGDGAERIGFFRVTTRWKTHSEAKARPTQWRERVGARCVGNSRLAFRGGVWPFLRAIVTPGHHGKRLLSLPVGDSSKRQDHALKLAASVYGGASYLQRWRATDNALEAIAAQHSDCLLILDELAQIDPKTRANAPTCWP